MAEKKSGKGAQIGLRVTPELKKALTKKAQKERRSLSEYIVNLLSSTLQVEPGTRDAL